ncbi:MAG: hypothetical protein LBD02_06725 [Christensenellaceae bacterium]|jgi:hypothetical protein|nr:hypothetical protein [Christensenellaceae bacterium]
MKKLLWLLGGALAALVLCAVLNRNLAGARPFQGLKAGEIASATVELYPPDVKIELGDDEITELAALLHEVVVFQRFEGYGRYAAQAVVYTLHMADGTNHSVNACNPFLIVDGEGYRAEYAPCERLNSLGNRLAAEKPGKVP